MIWLALNRLYKVFIMFTTNHEVRGLIPRTFALKFFLGFYLDVVHAAL